MATNPRADAAAPVPDDEPAHLADYHPVVLHRQRHDGWTAERQRTFLTALAETGCISEACRQTGITARSAYRLRGHDLGKAFADAWDAALRYATAKLMTLAYERAIKGSIRETWRDGKLVGESRQPSDRLLIFLLGNLAPTQRHLGQTWDTLDTSARIAARGFDRSIGTLSDCDVACDPLSDADFLAQPPASDDRRVVPFDEDSAEYEDW